MANVFVLANWALKSVELPVPWNAITDVPGVKVGHTTLHEGIDIHTGVTVIKPHGGDIFKEKVPAAIVVGNGFGKLVGSTQVSELGNIETPIALTNTLSVGTVMTALVRHALSGNGGIRSVNAVVGETNDGRFNDIRGLHISEEHVFEAIRSAESGPVLEGSVGAGSGTQCFGFKGGIGTSSRMIKSRDGKMYTLGVLVQTNFGGDLTIDGAPLGKTAASKGAALNQAKGDGSCMIVVATDAPLSVRNIERVARRALHGMARTGSSMSNGSGDYVIAFSTAYRMTSSGNGLIEMPKLIGNDDMTPYFGAVMDATEEAIYNSMFMATTVHGRNGSTSTAINLDIVRESVRRHASCAEPKSE
ncbi:MAG: D-aminopeptidase [Verrucomicrobiales bacterium]|jgi:D-aminopeptidase